jgi:fido (protein-threonine AMPylation protein)
MKKNLSHKRHWLTNGIFFCIKIIEITITLFTAYKSKSFAIATEVAQESTAKNICENKDFLGTLELESAPIELPYDFEHYQRISMAFPTAGVITLNNEFRPFFIESTPMANYVLDNNELDREVRRVLSIDRSWEDIYGARRNEHEDCLMFLQEATHGRKFLDISLEEQVSIIRKINYLYNWVWRAQDEFSQGKHTFTANEPKVAPFRSSEISVPQMADLPKLTFENWADIKKIISKNNSQLKKEIKDVSFSKFFTWNLEKKNQVLKGFYSVITASNILEKIKKLLTEVKNNPNQRDAISLAAYFHMKFTTIHPFKDANGRVARLIMNQILMDHHQPIAIFLFNQAYTEAVNKALQEKDYKTFEIFLRETVVEIQQCLPQYIALVNKSADCVDSCQKCVEETITNTKKEPSRHEVEQKCFIPSYSSKKNCIPYCEKQTLRPMLEQVIQCPAAKHI